MIIWRGATLTSRKTKGGRKTLLTHAGEGAGREAAAEKEEEVAHHAGRKGEGVAVGRDGGRARATEMTHHFLKRLKIGRNSRKRKK